MAATFPVIHSILDSAALAEELSAWIGSKVMSCQLISRGSNDIYRARTAEASFSVRVARAGWRSESELDYELGLLEWLRRRDLNVPEPVTGMGGELTFSLTAPEGQRSVVVFHWLDGTVLPPSFSADMARRIGQLLATMHAAGRDFVPNSPKPVHTMAKIRGHREALEKLFFNQPRVLALLEAATVWLEQALAALPKTLPEVHIHGDAHFGNLLVTESGELALIDFDECGQDMAVKDLLPFFWRNQVEGLSEELSAAFLNGYEAIRSLEPDETAALPLLLATRHLYLLATLAGTVNRMGPVAGFDARESHYVALLETHLKAAGFPG